MAVMALVAGGCGSSEPDGAEPTDVTEGGTTEPAEGATPGAPGATDGDDDPSDAPVDGPDVAGGEVEIATVSLPDGLRPWWESTNRSAPFGGAVYLLAASSEVAIGDPQPNVQVLRLDVSLEWTEVGVSIPTGVTSVDMFLTGSRLAVSYLDPAGEIVVLTSADGTDFDETRLPVPERYVAADTWSTTSLIGRVAGVADLGGEVFAIVNTGVNWRRPTRVAGDYAVEQEQDPEVAEKIRFANTIRGKPTGDGDMLYTFVKNDEVVAEVLASDAGIEAGYIAAYNNRGDDTFESQSWMIDGNTSRNLDTPPFNGREGITLHALYPIDGGVAALVTDFNIEAAQAEAFGAPGIYAAGTSVALARGSASDKTTETTKNGKDWERGEPLGAPNTAFKAVAWANKLPLFVLVVEAEEGVGAATSQNGSDWSNVDYTLDISIPGGGTLQVQVTGEKTFLVYSSADETLRGYRVEHDQNGISSIEHVSDLDNPEVGNDELIMWTNQGPVELFMGFFFMRGPPV